VRRKVAIAIVVLVAAIAIDSRRAPAAQWSTRAALAGVHAYQITISPLYDRMGVECRFTPTCSVYGETVIRRFGIMRGSVMATRRILRCGPWTRAATHDPPPEGP